MTTKLLRRRRFVNLVAENCTSSVCSLHRLDVSEHLFYPTTAEAEAAAAKPAAVLRNLSSLPAPTYNFRPAMVRRGVEEHLFGLANPRISESRILWRSHEGNTLVYDADTHTAWSMPRGLRYYGRDPIVISAPVPVADADANDDAPAPAPGEAEDLFVMCSDSGYRSFQVLRFDHSKPKPASCPDADLSWEWDSLPPPPLYDDSSIYSHVVLDGGRVICVSASPLDDGGGTFLCASSDLGDAVDAAARGVNKPSVTVKHHWKQQGLETPVGWDTVSAALLDLGGGRFCVAKIIDEVVMDEYPEYQNNVGKTAALLTGVEMVRGTGDGCSSSNPNPSSSSSSSEEGFRMVVHKSLRYFFRRERINWVL